MNGLKVSEITKSTVKVVVPVSRIIEDQIKLKYYKFAEKVQNPIVPGIDRRARIKSFKYRNGNNRRLVFFGQEWRRKGLPKVLSI